MSKKKPSKKKPSKKKPSKKKPSKKKPSKKKPSKKKPSKKKPSKKKPSKKKPSKKKPSKKMRSTSEAKVNTNTLDESDRKMLNDDKPKKLIKKSTKNSSQRFLVKKLDAIRTARPTAEAIETAAAVPMPGSNRVAKGTTLIKKRNRK